MPHLADDARERLLHLRERAQQLRDLVPALGIDLACRQVAARDRQREVLGLCDRPADRAHVEQRERCDRHDRQRGSGGDRDHHIVAARSMR